MAVIKKLRAGAIVHHSTYGWGIVKHVIKKANRIRVLFHDGKLKKVAPYNLIKASKQRPGLAEYFEMVWRRYLALRRPKRVKVTSLLPENNGEEIQT